MRYIYFLTIVSLLIPFALFAQPKVTNVDANPSGKTIAVTYDLSENADIAVSVSMNNGKTYRRLKKQFVKGDVGANVTAGKYKRINWHVLDENPNQDFRGNAKFKVRALPPFRPFVLAQGSYSFRPSQWAAGVMAGAVGVVGFYVRGETNFSMLKQCPYNTDYRGYVSVNGYSQLPFYSGKKQTTEFMVNAGGMVRLYIPLYLYFGAGYGCRHLYWELLGGDWAEVNKEYAPHGFTGDIGLVGNIKNFAISVGVSTIEFNYVEMNVGVGYFF